MCDTWSRIWSPFCTSFMKSGESTLCRRAPGGRTGLSALPTVISSTLSPTRPMVPMLATESERIWSRTRCSMEAVTAMRRSLELRAKSMLVTLPTGTPASRTGEPTDRPSADVKAAQSE